MLSLDRLLQENPPLKVHSGIDGQSLTAWDLGLMIESNFENQSPNFAAVKNAKPHQNQNGSKHITKQESQAPPCRAHSLRSSSKIFVASVKIQHVLSEDVCIKKCCLAFSISQRNSCDACHCLFKSQVYNLQNKTSTKLN